MSRADDSVAQADPFYFLDYALTIGSVRHHAAKTLEAAFNADRNNPIHRRLHAFNLLKEEFAAYEDAGAILDSFLRYRGGSVAVPLARLIRYDPRDVLLTRVFERHGIASGDDLHAALRHDELGAIGVEPYTLFASPELDDVRHLIEEVTLKK